MPCAFFMNVQIGLKLCFYVLCISFGQCASAISQNYFLVVAQSGVRSGTAGSLVVRSVLQPFEESTFTSFAKAVSGAGSGLSFILSMTPMFHSACSPLSGWPLFHVIHETWEFCSWVFQQQHQFHSTYLGRCPLATFTVEASIPARCMADAIHYSSLGYNEVDQGNQLQN